MSRRKQNFGRGPTAQDMDAAVQLHQAIVQTEDLPYEDRWAIVMELLPETFLLHVLKSDKMREEERLNSQGPLALVLVKDWAEEEVDVKEDVPMIMIAMLSLSISCIAEMEKRHKQFCREVIHMTDPFDFDLEEPVKYVPKDPETFSIQAMYQYYYDLADERE